MLDSGMAPTHTHNEIVALKIILHEMHFKYAVLMLSLVISSLRHHDYKSKQC